jgi:hypothetical protein
MTSDSVEPFRPFSELDIISGLNDVCEANMCRGSARAKPFKPC